MRGVDGVISNIYDGITQVTLLNRKNVEMYKPVFQHCLAGLWDKAIANLEQNISNAKMTNFDSS